MRALLRRGSRTGFVALAASVALVAGVFPARADVVVADSDVVLANNQTTKDLGTVAPGGTLSPTVSFTLECSNAKHVDSGQTEAVAYHSATMSPASDGSVSATSTSIGPVQASWPDDTTGSTNCGTTAPMDDNGDSAVTITAPTTAGEYSVDLLYKTGALTPAGTNDAASVVAEAHANFTFTVEESGPADADGDGVADAGDNCPAVANADQADVDADGLGDACDNNSYAPALDTAADDANGTEGDTLDASGKFTDGDGNSTLTLTSDAAAGTFTDNGDGTWDWSLGTSDDVATATVTVTASDGEHSDATDSFDYSADNANPVVGSVNVTVTGACSVSLTAGFSDAGTADTHTASIAWGDASTSTPAVTEANGSGSTNSATHSYATAGTKTITATVTDDDGGSGSNTGSFVTSNTPSAFLAPINSGAGVQRSVFKLGSTIPVKITVRDCAGALVTTLTPAVQLQRVDSVPDGSVNEAQITETPTNGKNMRWDGSQYLYNLSTKNSQFSGGAALAQGTYKLWVTDASFYGATPVYFDLK